MKIKNYKAVFDMADGKQDYYLIVHIEPNDFFLFKYYTRSFISQTQADNALSAAIEFEEKTDGITFRSLERLDDSRLADLNFALFFLKTARKNKSGDPVDADTFAAINSVESAINRLEAPEQ